MLEQGDTVEDVSLGFWTMINGAFGVLTGGAPLQEINHLNPPMEYCAMDIVLPTVIAGVP